MESKHSTEPERPAQIHGILKARGIEYQHNTNTWVVHDKWPCMTLGDALDCWKDTEAPEPEDGE